MGTLRFVWRQLTSMRTALLLLLLLAIAAVPGSIWPQRGIDAARVATYLDQHRTLGPWLDRLGFFDVYASPWFAAIYLLLFVSLVGCVLPRSRIHWHAMRAQPPRAPRRLERLPEHAELQVEASVEETVAAARAALRGKRFRIRKGVDGEDPHTLSGESGYLRETGNLVFHTALIVVIIGIAIGHLFGWRGDRIVPAGETFSNTISAYDTLDPGPWVDTEALKPFSVTINKLDVTFEERARGAQFGAPRDFTAHTTTTEGPGQPERQQTLKVNGPLQFGGASVFLLGNGYAPVVTVRDAKGNVTYSGATPFLPRDNNYLSAGAIKVGAAQPKQLGFAGFFLPTAEPTFANGPQSLFPDLKNPELAMSVWEGDLYPGGRPSSVYTLDTDHLSRVTKDGKPLLIRLVPGPDLPAARRPRQHHLRLGPALGGTVGPVRPGQDHRPGRGGGRARRSHRLADHPPPARVRAGPSRRRTRSGGGAGRRPGGTTYRGHHRWPRQGRGHRAGRDGRGPPAHHRGQDDG